MICFTSALAHDGSTKKEEGEPIIHRIDTTVLFVRDLTRCARFYRDTLGLQVKNSDPNSVAFLLEDRYLLLLEVSAAYELGLHPITVRRLPQSRSHPGRADGP
jgi:catechol 2,3-dioxygenase-like lactoylglutathione lyase family enzyme